MSRSIAALLLALALAVSAGPGCRSFQGNLLRRDVAQDAPKPEQPDSRALVRRVSLEHERRSQLVQALKSEMNVNLKTVTDEQGRDRRLLVGGSAEGYLRVERPKNLRVLLNKTLSMPIADIGSNDSEFWFANDQSQEIIVGSHSQLGGFSDPLLASLRPDWIFEILGLEPIPDSVEIRPDATGATLTLVEERPLPGGGAMVKESVLSVAEQRIVEHRLYTADKSRLVARARVDRPVPVAVSSGSEAPETVEIPSFVRLTIPDLAEMEMKLANIAPNPEADANWLAQFDRPEKEKQGYQMVDLYDLGAQPRAEALADASPSPRAPEPASSAPGSMVLPRSDRSVSRAEQASEPVPGPRASVDPVADRTRSGPVALELPSAPRVPTVEFRRSSWEAAGNRFPPAVIGRE